MPEIGVRDLDVLYQETDRLYYLLARGCGLSESAYWTLYDVDIAGAGLDEIPFFVGLIIGIRKLFKVVE